MEAPEDRLRTGEWFVPRFGPLKFRIAVGLLFLPYTGMVLSFTVIGAMLAPQVHWDRVVAIVAIYFLGLGIGAHALDAVGSKAAKPWGSIFPDRHLWLLAAGSVMLAYVIGIYYMVAQVPMLWPIAIAEGFFLLAYNLEWFRGRFHTDLWFAVSWGALPVLAGYVMQTNTVSPAALLVSIAMGLLSLAQIKASRPYKQLRKNPQADSAFLVQRLQSVLQSLSLGVIALGFGMLAWRLLG